MSDEISVFRSRGQAVDFIADVINALVSPREPCITNAIRRAKTITHPDHGGNARQFKMVG